jgi:hypothetical protein
MDKIRANFEVNKITFSTSHLNEVNPWVKKIPVLSIQGQMQGKTYIGDELFGLFDPPPQRFKKSLLGKSWTNTIHERA